MKRLATAALLVCCALFVFTAPAAAQEASLTRPTLEAPAAAQVSPAPALGAPAGVLHVTDRLNALPEARQALADFHAARAAGMLAPGKNTVAYTVGDTANFRVVTDLATSAPTRVTRRFVLKRESAVANLWVEVAELDNGNVTEEDLNRLGDALLLQTPAGSVDPTRGIVANDNALFGDPPNVDGDGRVDILLHDIEEGETTSNLVINGYVSSTDLSPSGGGNNRDVLYLDTDPTVSNPARFGGDETSVLITAAHEYQHLIHFNYDTAEETFVNEGLSGFAEWANGYDGRGPSYLQRGNEQNISLMTWRQGENNVIFDYQRGALFTQYIAERFGPIAAGAITRQTQRGPIGYRTELVKNGQALQSFLLDFHTANLINDPAVDARYAYANAFLTDSRANVLYVTDGLSTALTFKTLVNVKSGGVHYQAWTNVRNFQLGLELEIQQGQAQSEVIAAARVRAVLEHKDGRVEIRDVSPAIAQHTFPDDYARLTLIFVHGSPVASIGIGSTSDQITYLFEATWERDEAFRTESVVYDNGSVSSTNGDTDFYGLGAPGIQANRFDVPAGATLREVSVSPFYANQFSGTTLPSDAPRNFTLHVWADDGAGEPGEELFSKTFSDPRFNSTLSFNFYKVDLNSDQASLSNLPSPVYVGISNAGGDENYMVMGVAAFAQGHTIGNVSFLNLPQFGPNGSGGGWAPFDGITIGGEALLQNRVLPIRAVFSVPNAPVAVDDGGELPAEATLAQNYPNPFNPSTAIHYTLPRTSAVRLAVYDALGRRVATLVDGTQPAGTYEVHLDARQWATGLYVYTLETPERRLSRSMLLVK